MIYALLFVCHPHLHPSQGRHLLAFLHPTCLRHHLLPGVRMSHLSYPWQHYFLSAKLLVGLVQLVILSFLYYFASGTYQWPPGSHIVKHTA